ncbi:MAG: acetate--CoA ligase family protein, partial [Gemmatimonadales bacterium]|nr:acetate--CoA ligase family protein [Gemmatimonadales bacterium]
MKLHEYQAKELFAAAGIPVPRGAVAATADEAARAYETLRGPCLVKAQLHAGGRGKAGGILSAATAQEARTAAASLLGTRLVTAQTPPEGLPVSSVLLTERLEAATELYLAITLDRFRATPLILASRQGGVDIEAVAKTTPE